MKNLAVFVKREREELGITQRELAEKLRVHFSYISKIERNYGYIMPPGEGLLIEMAQVFDCDLEMLMEIAGKFSPAKLRGVTISNRSAASLVRRIQADEITIMQWFKISEILNE